MKRETVDRLIDSSSWFFIFVMVMTGMVLHTARPFGLPRMIPWEQTASQRELLFGWNGHEWGLAHGFAAVGFLFAQLANLIFHVRALWASRPELSTFRAVRGVVAAFVLIVIEVTPHIPKQQFATPMEVRQGRAILAAAEQGLPELKPTMRLSEVEKLSGVPSSYLLAALLIPPHTMSGDPTLDDIAEKGNKTMDEIAGALSRLYAQLADQARIEGAR